jgi:hypothetical protein
MPTLTHFRPPDPEYHHRGVHYLEFLGTLAKLLGPRSYFEIGTERGASLARFACDAVCVDPTFRIQGELAGGRVRTLLFQMNADDFFAAFDLKSFFPGGLDIAFLDGLHLFEHLLSDFMNTEGCCHRRSIIFLHDCLPLNPRMAERTQRLDEWWTGDVWRLLPILHKYRPGLRIFLLDCPPTGLVAVTNVEPKDSVLRREYHAIIDEYQQMDLPMYGLDRLWSLFPTLDSQKVIAEETITSIFPTFSRKTKS